MNMSMFTWSRIAVAGLLIAMVGIGRTGERAIPLAIGLAVSIVALGWGILSLQKQVDALRNELDSTQAEKTEEDKA